MVVGQRPVYLSHSISQARRHISGLSSRKCPSPNRPTGIAFAEEVNDVGRQLSDKGVAVQEPTCIDEYRIDHKYFKSFDLDSLSKAFLPAVLEGWPLRPTERLLQAKEHTNVGLANTEVEYLAECSKLNPGSGSWTPELQEAFDCLPESLVGLAQEFEFEVLRQITARDYMLTTQARAVLVYRPYSNDSVPEISGGVKSEVDCCLALSRLGAGTAPALVLLHPWTDEVHRRINILTGGLIASAWNNHGKGALPKELVDELKSLFSQLQYLCSSSDAIPKCREIVAGTEKLLKVPAGSSMLKEAPGARLVQREAFIKCICNEILDESELYTLLDSGTMKIFDCKEINEDIIACLG